MAVGQDLIDQGHFGSHHVQERLDDVNAKWDHLIDLMDTRKRRLTEVICLLFSYCLFTFFSAVVCLHFLFTFFRL